jgi:hypothetical protein
MRKFHWTLPLTIAACLMSAPAHADRSKEHADGSKEVVVVTHIDVDPQFVNQTLNDMLVGFVEDSRDDSGVKSFTMITQDPTTNHFQLIEVFAM